jgi:hypothetical protein
MVARAIGLMAIMPDNTGIARPCCRRNRVMSPMNLMSSRVLTSAEPPEVRDAVQLVLGEAGQYLTCSRHRVSAPC